MFAGLCVACKCANEGAKGAGVYVYVCVCVRARGRQCVVCPCACVCANVHLTVRGCLCARYTCVGVYVWKGVAFTG